MIQLQQDYQISDELFWEIFNTRVLLNKHIDISDFLGIIPGTVGRA